MRAVNLVVFAFLLLAPCDYFREVGPKCVYSEYASSRDPRKKAEGEMTSSSMGPRRPRGDDWQETLPVKVQYESKEEQKYVDGKKINVKEKELCPREVEVVKDAAAKLHTSKVEKSKQKPQGISQPVETSRKEEYTCGSPQKKDNVLCADCEQCEVQVQANGEGVVLRCKNCREMPPEEVIFPAGNNRRIIKLP